MKILTFVSLALLSVSSFAKTVARVADYGGKSFLFSEEGVSKELQYGDKISDLSQLMVDDEAYISIIDNKGNIFFIAGGSYVKFLNNMLEVQNGYVWTKAKSKNEKVIRTINSVAKVTEGEFITTVDSMENRSQVLVLFGEVSFSSALETQLTIPVKSGEFTFIDESYERGLPRRPTRVGIKSYHKIKSVFANISSLKSDQFERSFLPQNSEPKQVRAIASIPTANSYSQGVNSHRGKLIYYKASSSETSGRTPSSVDEKMNSYDYYQKVRVKKVKKVQKAEVKYYGFEFNSAEQPSAKVNAKEMTPRVSATPKIMIKTPKKEAIIDRQPASVAPDKSSANANIIDDINSVFEKSYRSNLKDNQKHSDEVNGLIDELKTFRNDFKKNY